MKVDIKTKESGTRVAQKNIVWINFNDKEKKIIIYYEASNL